MEEYLSDLHACISCLGILENKKFIRDVDTIVSLRDILRHLRRETEKCEIRLELGKFKVIENCLISLLKLYNDDSVLFDLVIRLLMNLTQPSYICFKQELPKDSIGMETFIKVDEMLQKCKSHFTDREFLEVLSCKINDIYLKEWADRSEDEHLLVERILILIRNILHINTSQSDRIRGDGVTSKQDKLVMGMMGSGWGTLLIYLANAENEERFTFHTLEIISLMFREQSAEFMDSLQSGNSTESASNEQQLTRQRQLELAEKSTGNHRVKRFGGTFELQHVKTESGRPMIYHHDINWSKIDLTRDRKLRRKAKNQVHNKEEIYIHKSTDEVLNALREFCRIFLNIGYNSLMRNALSSLQRQQMQADDETYYLWALRFFMEVCRRNKLSPESVSETVSIGVFHWVYQQAMIYIDNGKSRECAVASYRKLHLVMSVYKELLEFCLMLDNHQDTKYRTLSASIKSRVFYSSEYIEIYPMLLTHFKPIKQSRAYLRTLIEGSYLIIRILQDHNEFGMKFVGKKLKRLKSRSKRKSKGNEENRKIVLEMPPEQDEDGGNVLRSIWGEMLETVMAAVNGEIELPLNLPVIYDPLLPECRESIEPDSEPVDSQLKRALGLVQIRLRQRNPIEAVAIFEWCQKLWPEEDRIMVSEDENRVEEEIKILRDIMFANKFYNEEDLIKLSKEINGIGFVKENEEVEEDEMDDEENDDEDINSMQVREVPFDFSRFIRSFCHPNVVNTFGILFEDIITNPPSTNNRLLRIMHIIAEKTKQPYVLYQLKLFNGFNKFLLDPLSNNPEFKALKKFVIFIIKKFTEHVKSNRKLLLEVLFSKNIHEAHETVYGYSNSDETDPKEWTDELEAELVRLFEEVQHEDILPGFDKASVIESRFSDKNKTRRQILNRMVTLGLISSAKEMKNKKRENNPWTADEQARLIILVEESRDQPNPIKEIMNGLRATSIDTDKLRSRGSVIKKILDLGLVENKQQLGIRDKNSKLIANYDSGSDDNDREPGNQEDNNNDDDDDDDDDNENESKFMNDIFQQSLSAIKRNPPPLKVTRKIDWTTLKIIYAQLDTKVQEWFVETLEDNIDSRANGIVGPLAIVPLREHDSEILNNKLLQRLLYICEFLYPDQSKGHLFWRIPEEMTAKELEYFKNCVTNLTESELEALAMESVDDQSKHDESKDLFSSKSKNDINEIPTEMFRDSENILPLSSDDDNDQDISILKKVRKSKIQRLISDDEEEDCNSQQTIFANKSFKTILSNSANTENVFKKLTNSFHLLMSDEDEAEPDNNADMLDNGIEDRENIQKKTKRIFEDSDEEDEIISKRKKLVKVIADDDDSN